MEDLSLSNHIIFLQYIMPYYTHESWIPVPAILFYDYIKQGLLIKCTEVDFIGSMLSTTQLELSHALFFHLQAKFLKKNK